MQKTAWLYVKTNLITGCAQLQSSVYDKRLYRSLVFHIVERNCGPLFFAELF